MARNVRFLLSLLAVIMLAGFVITVSAQHPPQNSPQKMKLNEVPRDLATVDFLAEAPVIDGVLDPDLRRLPRREFSQVDLRGTAEKPVEAHYRLAYGTNFLYVYVEAQADKLTYNDRAYQNGGGFHMVIARPQPGDGPTDEFYVAACSAVNRPELDWTRRLFWYYNVDKIFVPMSRQARLESAAHDGVISFELLLPWQDLHPYHPWLSDGIGFNLGFVKASGQGSLYYRVLPEGLGDETRIILTGFSMGGYGVYRTFYEHPTRYKALAIFSGHPDIASEYFPGEGHPNFLEEKNLGKFKGMPIFIFHGREDRNCPFAITQELAVKLERAGARVELVTEAGAGHQQPGPEALARYHEWLKTVSKN